MKKMNIYSTNDIQTGTIYCWEIIDESGNTILTGEVDNISMEIGG